MNSSAVLLSFAALWAPLCFGGGAWMVRAKLRTLKAKELWVMRGMALLFAGIGVYAFLSAAGITSLGNSNHLPPFQKVLFGLAMATPVPVMLAVRAYALRRPEL